MVALPYNNYYIYVRLETFKFTFIRSYVCVYMYSHIHVYNVYNHLMMYVAP